jgi:hypothetical protein
VQWPDEIYGTRCSPSILVEDSLLSSLQGYGGSTATILPGPGSPALGRGTSCPPPTSGGSLAIRCRAMQVRWRCRSRPGGHMGRRAGVARGASDEARAIARRFRVPPSGTTTGRKPPTVRLRVGDPGYAHAADQDVHAAFNPPPLTVILSSRLRRGYSDLSRADAPIS